MKQYIVVRADLPDGAQAVQACHAMKRFTLEHHKCAEIENLALLSVPSERALLDLLRRAEDAGVAISAFYEPDFGDELTAIGLGTNAGKLVSCLPLALRAKKNQVAA